MTAETEVQESPGAEFDVELSIAALKLRLFALLIFTTLG